MAARKPVYDLTERNRIREGLERYRNLHAGKKLGVPDLSKRIARAIGDGENTERVPWKTLQRFLKGTFSADEFVGHCKVFLETVEPPPPYEEMGEAIVNFFDRAPLKPKDRMHHAGLLDQMFARKYRSYLQGVRKVPDEDEDDPLWPIPDIEAGEPAFEIPYSVLEFEPLPRTPFLKVSEYVWNPLRTAQWDRAMSTLSAWGKKSATDKYTGVLSMCTGPQLYAIVLRRLSFEFPRFYLLFDLEKTVVKPQSQIIGSCLTVADDPSGYNPAESFQVKLFPVSEEEPGI